MAQVGETILQVNRPRVVDLATDAVRLLSIPGCATGKALVSRWLIHLAGQPDHNGGPDPPMLASESPEQCLKPGPP